MKKNISDILQRHLTISDKHHILIKDTNFFADLAEPTGTHSVKRIFMFCIIAICLAFCVIFIVTGAIFYIKDILLFYRPPMVTESGSIIPQRSCNREQVIFFFNAADCWASTGVQLLEGDKIRISHSGGFYSDIDDLCTQSRSNETLKYPYYDSKVVVKSKESPAGASSILKYTLYNDNNKNSKEAVPRFGSILWQISNENSVKENPTKGNIHQIEPREDYKKYITIEENGEIFFSVNDIFLDDSILDDQKDMEQAKKDSIEQCTSLHDKVEFARKNGIYYICKESDGKDTTFLYQKEDMKSYLANHPEARLIWFNDNIGNVMICIEIVRHVRSMPWYAQWYRETEDMFFNDLENTENPWKTLFIVLRDGLKASINLVLQILILPILLIHNQCYYKLSDFLWKNNGLLTLLFLITAVSLSIIYTYINTKRHHNLPEKSKR